MAYGLSTRMHLEVEGATSRPAPMHSSAAAYALLWERLPRTERLAVIERELKKAA